MIIFLLGTPAEMLPKPLLRFQYEQLNTESLERWLDDIIRVKKLGISTAQRDAFLRKVEPIISDYEATHVVPTQHKWDGAVSRPLAISNQYESPFELSELIRIARKHLILIAQNHGFMTDPNGERDTIKGLLFDKLAAGLTVDIVAMHPQAFANGMSMESNPCVVWANYMGAPHFQTHVRRCWDTLFSWNDKYTNEVKSLSGKLRIKGAYLLPVSINIVDPEHPDGLLVLSPRMAQEASAPRPQFVAAKRYEPRIFSFYWQTISNSFENSGWLGIEKLARLPDE